MYRFYREVAGAKIREVEYQPPGMEFPLQAVLDAITPATRAVLLANPNNPTGTGISLLGHRAHSAPRAARRGHGGRSLLRILRHHRAGRNRARAQPVRLPHVFESLRHGRHAPGLPVLPRSQCRVPAQSAIALQREFAGGDRRPGRRRPTKTTSGTTWRRYWRRAKFFASAWSGSASPTCPARRISCWRVLARAPSRCGTRCASAAILVRDRSYEAPGCVRITVGTRQQTRQLLAALEEIWRR